MSDTMQTAALAHDIRNILSPALLSAEMVSAKEGARLKRHTDSIFKAIDQTVALCQDAISTNHEVAPAANVVLQDVIDDAVALSKGPSQRRVKFVTSAKGCAHLNVDRDLLCQMISDIAQNAFKAIAEVGGVVRIRAVNANGTLNISVQDNGPGIPSAVLDRLFPSNAKRPERCGRIGLGIPMTAAAARRLGGQLILVSTGAAGTHFKIVIPNACAASAS